MLIVAVAPSIPVVIVGATLFGAGSGMFLAVDWALMTDIIPKASSGRYMGISNVATATAGIFSLLTGGKLMDIVNGLATVRRRPARGVPRWRSLYFAVGALLLRPVVEPPVRVAPSRIRARPPRRGRGSAPRSRGRSEAGVARRYTPAQP